VLSGSSKAITADQAGQLARELGLAPSQEDIERLKEAKGDDVSYEDFHSFLVKSTHPEDSEDLLVGFFEHFDLEKSGKLSKVVIRNLLANFGEPIHDDCIEAILGNVAGAEDPCDYRKLVRSLLGK
jgi:Ca2+-binding EF-hand superfamily protein